MVNQDQQADKATPDSLDLLETKATPDLLDGQEVRDGRESMVFLVSVVS